MVYIWSLYTDASVSVRLVAAKSKVAPLKKLTLPKLELAGVWLLAKLPNKVRSTLDLNLSQLYAWSNSQIVLAWLDGSSLKLQTFVSNHVTQIMEFTCFSMEICF